MEVLDVAAAGGTVAAALSDGAVRLFRVDASSGRLAPSGVLLGHSGPVTAVSFASPALLLTVASDGVREVDLSVGDADVTQPTARRAAAERLKLGIIAGSTQIGPSPCCCWRWQRMLAVR